MIQMYLEDYYGLVSDSEIRELAVLEEDQKTGLMLPKDPLAFQELIIRNLLTTL